MADYESMLGSNGWLTPSSYPIAIFWDIENCCVPTDVMPEDVAGNIRMALAVHPWLKGPVTLFSAYGDFTKFSRKLREGCQKTGVNLIDVPSGRKDAADKAILVDMFLFALDNPPPSTIFLISGDVDFSVALYKLGQRNFITVLAVPFNGKVSSVLFKASHLILDWPSLARGELIGQYSRAYNPSRYFLYHPSSKMPDVRNHDHVLHQHHPEPSIKYDSDGIDAPPLSKALPSVSDAQNTPVLSALPQRDRVEVFLTTSMKPTKESSAPFNGTGVAEESQIFMQPSSVQDLMKQLACLLLVYGGRLSLSRVGSEYIKAFGKRLPLLDNGFSELVELIKDTNGELTIERMGNDLLLCLKESSRLLGDGAKRINLLGKHLATMKMSGEVQEVTGKSTSNVLTKSHNVRVSELTVDATEDYNADKS